MNEEVTSRKIITKENEEKADQDANIAPVAVTNTLDDEVNVIRATSELGNEVKIPLTNPDITPEQRKMIQESIAKYGVCFATCPQETKIVKDYEFKL